MPGYFQIARFFLEGLPLREERMIAWLSVEERVNDAIGTILESLWGESFDVFCNRHKRGSNRLFRGVSFAPPTPPDHGGAMGSYEIPEDIWTTQIYQEAPVGRRDLVVVDSLSALVHWVRLCWPGIPDDRQALLSLLRSFRQWRRDLESRPTVIFTMEALRKRPTVLVAVEAGDKLSNIAAQSYIADVIIDLQNDVLECELPRTFEKPSEWKKWEEPLRMCRVTKGRGLPIQQRSSCYEFVRKHDVKGIEFFPTYASPGVVSLFYENEPQEKEFNDFRNIDIPRQFPRLVVQGFSRSWMRRMFAIHRYQHRIPHRHPVALSSIDEYWVDVLRSQRLLAPINPRDLELYSIPKTESRDNRNKTIVIKELSGSNGASPGKADCYRDQDTNEFLAVPYMANVGMLVYRRDLLKEVGRTSPPETWEELEATCEELRGQGKPHHLLLETLTNESLMSTALELCWSHAGFWLTKAAGDGGRSTIQFEECDRKSGLEKLRRALARLYSWFHEKRFVPIGCSVDPERHPQLDWAFARHWYSTWVDYLTKRDAGGHLLVCLQGNEEFGVAPIPVAESYRQEHGEKALHRSAWGEWYLGIQSGSENVELGVELINNLMTSRKIRERALSGAGIPTVEPFYRTWGERMCYGIDLTYNQVRKTFFGNARSRSEFHDYRKFASIFSGILDALMTNPNVDPGGLLDDGFGEIES